MDKDIAFEMAASHVRFGVGVTHEVGMDLKEIGARRVLVVTDPVVAKLPPVRTVLESLDRSGVPFDRYGDPGLCRARPAATSNHRVGRC